MKDTGIQVDRDLDGKSHK
nr:Chain C, PROTEIN (NNOS, NEURONAL NITRIC OXIDE SYNTHASE) [synthetic construct]1F96_D Chain D, PROTEIN (NNOS, NEURONAL NITRIC OXIDE SYNTHASE) [synthetic construct]